MVAVKIGTEERNLQTADESWINRQINLRRRDGQNPCVRVRIDEEALNMVLSTPTCPAGAEGGRTPNPKEKEVFELWDPLGLRHSTFTGGNLVAFIKQLRRFLC